MLHRTIALLALVMPIAIAAPRATAGNEEPSLSAQLLSYYGNAGNYRKVKRDVLDWHKTTTNGCVAFASTALRHVGYQIPIAGKRDGWGISRITFAFSAYLEEAGWSKVDKIEELVPGDLAFTTGYPDHVFVFHSWANNRRRVARVLDNQGYLTRRPLSPTRPSRVSAFAYALRAP
jgi:hypothetical protein